MNDTFYPAAMTIAGSDSSGGAGIQADLKAFRFFEVYGTSALTAVTAQNPDSVESIYPLPRQTVTEQIETVTDKISLRAAKTGMLFNREIIEAVTEKVQTWQKNNKLVVDPVMVAGSGARLLQEKAVESLRSGLLPLAAIITPNIPEAEILAESSITDKATAVTAAKKIAESLDCAVVLKGGHRIMEPMLDLLLVEDNAYWLSSPQLHPPNSHGTGCAMSAAIAACLALDMDIVESVIKAKAYVYEILGNCCRLGKETWCPGPAKKLPLNDISIDPLTD